MECKPKTIFQLDTPFTNIQWPEVPPTYQETILELLCSLLCPIGRYRVNHVPPSKGKRSKKRKRQDAKPRKGALEMSRPPPPEISSSIVVGLGNITRSLESWSRKSKPDAGQSPNDPNETASETLKEEEEKSFGRHFSAVFVLSSILPAILQEHLPQLIATASRAHPDLPATRLVQLPKGCEGRLCEALGLQRVSVIGVLDGAAYSQSLIDLVREHIREVEIPWLQQVKKSMYLPVNIKAIDTFSWVASKEGKVS